CHALANPLTAHYGVTHGVAIGVLLPHVIRFNAPAVGGLYGDLTHDVGLANGDQGAAAEALARRITALVQRAGVPTRLARGGISRVGAEEAGEQWTGRFNPGPVTETELLQMYEAAF